MGVFLMGSLGCVPMKDLSSYTEGAAQEQSESPQVPPEQSVDTLGASTAEAAPSPTETASIEERPTAPALDPTPVSPPGTEAEPGNTSPTVRTTTVDAGADCAGLGGFTIAETSSCYLLGASTTSWQEARDFCQAWGGDLVEIGSAEENTGLTQRVNPSVWLGANDLEEEGTFRWAGGNPLEYMWWAAGQPNDLMGLEDCSELPPFSDGWVDVPCTGDVDRQPLCEQPPSSSTGEGD
jgi:hypothetical protein